VGSLRECTRILGLEGFWAETIEWQGDGPCARVRIRMERRGIRGYECSGCRGRTWRVRDRGERTWDDLPWAEHPVTLVQLPEAV
jgi:transposase